MIPELLRLVGPGSPFELRLTQVEGRPCRTFIHAPASVSGIVDRAATFGAQVFLANGGESITFAELLGRARGIAQDLTARGVAEGERVALLMTEGSQWVEVFFALLFSRAVPVLLHVGMDSRALSHAIERSAPHRVLVDDRGLASLDQVDQADAPGVFHLRDLGTDAIRVVDGARFAEPNGGFRCDADTEALVIFTSGSSARPKAVSLSNRNVITGLMNMMLGALMLRVQARISGERSRPTVRDAPCTLSLLPLAHIGGCAQLLLNAYLGGQLILGTTGDAQEILGAIGRGRVSSLNGISQVQIRTLVRHSREILALNTLRTIHIHGAALEESTRRAVAENVPEVNVTTGYGLTETFGSLSVGCASELSPQGQNCGHIIPSADVSVRLSDGAPASETEGGEIWVRGAMTAQGYCAGTTLTGILNDGWLRTGDLGRVSSEGTLYVDSRIGSQAPSACRHVTLEEVERTVAEDPSVEEVLAFTGSATEPDGPLVVAIRPRKGVEVDVGKVRRVLSYLLERSGAAGQSACEVIECGEIPRTLSGKPDRNEAQRLFWRSRSE